MPSYLVETYLGRGRADERAAHERRVRSEAAALARRGMIVRFGCAFHMPEDELCFYVLDAPSRCKAALVARRAGLEPLRVVEAIPFGEGVQR